MRLPASLVTFDASRPASETAKAQNVVRKYLRQEGEWGTGGKQAVEVEFKPRGKTSPGNAKIIDSSWADRIEENLFNLNENENEPRDGGLINVGAGNCYYDVYELRRKRRCRCPDGSKCRKTILGIV